jgi:hypothetical protein
MEWPFGRKTKLTKLLDRLEVLGFYKYADHQHMAQLKAEARASGFLFDGDSVRRIYHADSEDLAEGYAWELLEQLIPFLQELGVQISSLSHVFDNDVDYTMTVNDVRYLLLSVQEEQQLDMAELWRLGTERTFIIINTLLEQAGSDERVFQLYGGNDCHAVFLTPPMYHVIRTSGLFSPTELPIAIGEHI